MYHVTPETQCQQAISSFRRMDTPHEFFFKLSVPLRTLILLSFLVLLHLIAHCILWRGVTKPKV